MKGKVPRRIPGIFPFVGHRDDIVVVQVEPFLVAPLMAVCGRRGERRVAVEPPGDVVIVELLGPEHSGESLALHGSCLGVRHIELKVAVELIGFSYSPAEDLLEPIERTAGTDVAEPHADGHRSSARDAQRIQTGCLRPALLRIDRPGILMDNPVIDAILGISLQFLVMQSLDIRFVFTEQQLIRAVERDPGRSPRGGGCGWLAFRHRWTP